MNKYNCTCPSYEVGSGAEIDTDPGCATHGDGSTIPTCYACRTPYGVEDELAKYKRLLYEAVVIMRRTSVQGHKPKYEGCLAMEPGMAEHCTCGVVEFNRPGYDFLAKVSEMGILNEEECDQCGNKRSSWQHFLETRCPDHANPYRSCDGKLINPKKTGD